MPHRRLPPAAAAAPPPPPRPLGWEGDAVAAALARVVQADWAQLETLARPLAGSCRPYTQWTVNPAAFPPPLADAIAPYWAALARARPDRIYLEAHPSRRPLAYYQQWVATLRQVAGPAVPIAVLSGEMLAELPDVGATRVGQAARTLAAAGASAIGPGHPWPRDDGSAVRARRESQVLAAGVPVVVEWTVAPGESPGAAVEALRNLTANTGVAWSSLEVVLAADPDRPLPTVLTFARLAPAVRIVAAATVTVAGLPSDPGTLWVLGRFGVRHLRRSRSADPGQLPTVKT